MPFTVIKRNLTSLYRKLDDPLSQEVLEFIPTNAYLAFIAQSNVKKLAQLKSKLRWGWVGGGNIEEILLCQSASVII